MYVGKSEKHKLSPIGKKVFFIILIILISLEIILFIFIKNEDLKSLDIDTTKYLQESLFKEDSTNITLKINRYLNDIYTPYFLIAVIYNFFTVYDSFILVNMLSVIYFFSFLFKIIYYKSSYKNYDFNVKNIEIYYCGLGYAFPSEEMIIAVSFYLSIWKISNKLSFKFTKNKKVIKYIFFVLIIGLLFYYNFCTLLQGYYFLSHIIFSIIFGIIVYLIFLESNFFNLLKGNEFMDFIRKYNILYIIINLSLFVVFSLVYIIIRLNIRNNNNKYEICTDEDGKEFNNSENYYSYLDGTFVFNVLLLSNVFSMVGINLDLKFIYKDNEYAYIQNNFPQEFDELINTKSKGSFGGSIHINQEIVWNGTTLFVSLLRLIFLLVFCWACFFPYIFVHLNNEHITLVLFIKMFLPPMFFFMGIFFYLKPLLKLMRLTNFTLQSISADI